MFDLISQKDYEDLPEDPEDCFLQLEAICRRNLIGLLNDEELTVQSISNLQARYMHIVASAASEMGVATLDAHEKPGTWAEVYSLFSLDVDSLVTRLNLRRRKKTKPLSVLLEMNTKTKIRFHLTRIREDIPSLDMDDSRRSRLLTRLADFEKVLEQRRTSIAEAGIFYCAITAAVGAVVTMAADAPAATRNVLGAAQTIMGLIGADKETEDQAVGRLTAPRIALPAPTPPTPTTPHSTDVPINEEVPT